MSLSRAKERFDVRSIPLILTLAALLTMAAWGEISSFVSSSDEDAPMLSKVCGAAELSQAEPPEGEDDGGMSPDGCPVGSSTAVILASTAPSIGLQGARTTDQDRSGKLAFELPSNDVLHSDYLSTTSLVQTSLGRRFTLVGSKPSGTS